MCLSLLTSSAIVEETLTSDEYVAIAHSENINCHSRQAARKKYAKNIKHALDFSYYSQFYMVTFHTATHGAHATLNSYLSFWCIY